MKDVDDVVTATRQTRFLSKEDVADGLVVTPSAVVRDVIAFNGEPHEETVVYFEEKEVKPLILKPTVAQQIASIVGSRKARDWIGQKVELFHDPSVTFTGKVVGGIRARAVSQRRNGGRARKPVPPGLRTQTKLTTEETEEIRFQ